MNITQKRLRAVIADFTAYNYKFICTASPTFREMWNDAATKQRLRDAARRWLHATNNTDYTVDSGICTCLFYPRTIGADTNTRHRAVRLAFLNALLNALHEARSPTKQN